MTSKQRNRRVATGGSQRSVSGSERSNCSESRARTKGFDRSESTNDLPSHLDTALKQGLWIYPQRPRSARDGKKAKSPYVKWRERPRPSAADVERWLQKFPGALWALRTGVDVGGLVVIDYDTDDWRDELDRAYLGPNVVTPSGGAHLHVNVPFAVKSVTGVRPGVDLKAEGSLATFYGRRDTGEYEWRPEVGPWDLDELPSDLRDLIEQRRMDRGPRAEIVPEGDPRMSIGSPTRLRHANYLLGWALTRVEEIGRNRTGYDLAEQLRDHGLPKEEAASWMRSYVEVVPTLKTRADGSEDAYTITEALDSLEQAYSREPREPWLAQRGSVDDLDVETEYQRQKTRSLARERLRQEELAEQFVAPETGGTLADALTEDLPPVTYTFGDLLPTGANALLAAQFKVGKTTLLGNVMRSWCDGSALLGLFGVADCSRRVAFWNYELDERQFLAWCRDLGIENADRAVVLNLRGFRMPLTVDHVEDWTVDWLRDNDVGLWIIDPFARAFDGENENDNSQVGRFLEALDVIKRRAGVSDLVMAAHYGRQQGVERARGATRLDDWADVRWLLNKADDATYFSADGRDVHVPEARLNFDPETRRLLMQGGSREDERTEDGVRQVVTVVAAEPGIGKRRLLAGMTGDSTHKDKYVHEALKRGLVKFEKEGRAHRYQLTDAGEKFHLRRVEMKDAS